jgi:hypothetical protein
MKRALFGRGEPVRFQKEWLFREAIKNPAVAGYSITLFFDEVQVCHRTALKLSFARA